jgi:DNA-binding transcriptional LysR family regulator
MNIHHLELFYYVARHGGISQGVRHMPYGIQQPAMSAQIIQLEESLGVALFQRRPFALSAAGQELYEFVQPFFENITSTADRLRGGISQQIRIGASEVVLRDYLPPALQEVRKQFPKLRLTLRSGYHPQLCAWLEAQQLDLAITLLEQKPPAGMHVTELITLAPVLLVRRDSGIMSAEELWKRDRIEEPLITLPEHEPVCRAFEQGLRRRGVDWFPSIEVSTLKLVETYAAHGYGIGLTIALPKMKVAPPLRVLSLDGFDPVRLGALWSGKPTPIMQAFLQIIEQMARSLV